MTDHIVEPTKMVCVHCGLPFSKRQSEIDCYSCGSSYAETFKPQWARSMTCLELQNGQLQERIKRMKVAGDAMAHDHNPFTYMDWQRAKEDKP